MDKYAGVNETWNLDDMPWPWEKNSWDVVQILHVLEHLKEPLDAIREAERILKPGGVLIIEAPHPMSPEFPDDPTHRRALSLTAYHSLCIKQTLKYKQSGFILKTQKLYFRFFLMSLFDKIVNKLGKERFYFKIKNRMLIKFIEQSLWWLFPPKCLYVELEKKQ